MQTVIQWHAQAAHMGEKFDPWQEEPQACAGDSGQDISADEIEKTEARKQKR